jgi:hypothetical protein
MPEPTAAPAVECSEKCPDCHPMNCHVFFECEKIFKEGKIGNPDTN